MRQADGPLESPWFRVYDPRPEAKLRLVCFPHAGGTASFFQGWSEDLPPAIELVGVQYPGREERIREPLVGDVHVLADRVAEAAAEVGPEPLVLFGHSMGAAVAFETARRLERWGDPEVIRLFVSAHPPPGGHSGGTRHLRGDEVLVHQMRRLGGTGEAVLENPELRAMVLRILRTDYRAAETYEPVSPSTSVACPITAIRGEDDPEVDASGARGWADFTSGGLELETLPGGHFYLRECRRILIRRILDSVRGGPGRSRP